MRTNSQWNVYASDDVVCVSMLLILETTLTSQKLITSYLPIYLGGEVRWASRTTSLVLSTTDALKSVGFCHKGELPFSNNLDLRVGSAHMQLIDWNYEANPRVVVQARSSRTRLDSVAIRLHGLDQDRDT